MRAIEYLAATKIEDETNRSRDELIEKLMAAVPPQRRPGGVTAPEMGKVWGISRGGARARLEAMVDAGVLVRRIAATNVGHVVVYYDADEWAAWEDAHV